MDEDATWYGSRHRHRPHCIRRVPSAPRKGHSTPSPSFRPMSCGHGRPSQLVLSFCYHLLPIIWSYSYARNLLLSTIYGTECADVPPLRIYSLTHTLLFCHLFRALGTQKCAVSSLPFDSVHPPNETVVQCATESGTVCRNSGHHHRCRGARGALTSWTVGTSNTGSQAQPLRRVAQWRMTVV